MHFNNFILKGGDNINKDLNENNSENFDVIISSDIAKDDTETTIITTAELGKQWLEQAMRNYDPTNKQYSTFLNEGSSYSSKIIDKAVLDNLAVNPQNDLRKVLDINTIARTYANKDWIIGKVIEVIDTNVNSEYRLSYNDFEGSNDIKELTECKQIIEDFNDYINVRRLIKNAVASTFTEGNYVFYCRTDENGIANISWFPLGVVEISDYEINGEPQVLVNMNELKARLVKTYKKTKKNKALFFDKIGEEIKENYPPEVYQAYLDKDDYALLDTQWVGVMRINNQNRKYGITPIFKALYPALVLEQFDETDRINSKAKAKKFIVQLLNEKLLGESGTNDGFEEQAWAHENLVKAFQQKTVLVTTPAYVKDIKYVEPSVSTTENETVQGYINRELSTLGISFLMNSSSTGASVASISLQQLMKTINSITEQLEFILERFYRNLLIESGHNPKFAPKIRVLDSELLEMETKQELAKLLYCNFNSSLETALDILGIDINDEKAKRKQENDEKLHELFFPRSTAFTSSGSGEIIPDNVGGRPKDNNVDTKAKQDYDTNYNKEARV